MSTRLLASKIRFVCALICAVALTQSAWGAPEVAPPESSAPESSAPESLTPNAAVETPAANANELAISYAIDLNSRYVFRGVALGRGAVVQPTVTLEKRDYSFTVFGNVAAARHQSGGRRFNEVDLTLAKSINRGNTTVEPSAVLYLYPNGERATGELAVRLTYERKNTTFFTDHYLDFIEAPGAYFGDVGVSQRRSWNDKTSGEASLSLGFGNAAFNEFNIGPRRAAAVVAALDLSLSYTLSERYTLRPHLGLTRVLDRRLRDELSGDADLLNAGLTLEGTL